MKYVYASRTGNVASFIAKLGIEADMISDGSESVSEDYIVFTYTDGYGDVPFEVDSFVANNASYIKGVISSGDTSYGDAYCKAGDVISETYNVPCLYKFELDGTDEDVAAVQDLLK